MKSDSAFLPPAFVFYSFDKWSWIWKVSILQKYIYIFCTVFVSPPPRLVQEARTTLENVQTRRPIGAERAQQDQGPGGRKKLKASSLAGSWKKAANRWLEIRSSGDWLPLWLCCSQDFLTPEKQLKGCETDIFAVFDRFQSDLVHGFYSPYIKFDGS